ncbi:hypothetical protein V8E55_007752 [Tylopilus felleus]
MSTTQPTVTTPSTAPSPSTPNSNASTLLFGFLVSALSIFAVFMTFAIVWSRLIARRRAIDAMLGMSPPLQSPRLRRPKMWNIWVIRDEQSPLWLDLKPVAAQQCDCLPSSSRTAQTEQTTPFWRRRIWDRLPPEITYLLRRPIIPSVPTTPSDTDIPQIELSDGSDIQVSLLIAMPHAPQSTREGTHESHELVFATTNVLYHDPTLP